MKTIILVILVFILSIGCTKENIEPKINNQEYINDMAKIISSYGTYTANDLKTRADIPAQIDMTVSGSDVLTSNIKLTSVKNLIGYTDSTLSGICNSNLVNKYSNFSSGRWILNAGALTWQVYEALSLGNFAGYNHNATAPQIISYNNAVSANENVSTNISITLSFDISEINWYSVGVRKIGVNTKMDGVSQAITYVTLAGNSYDVQNSFNVSLSTNKTLVTELFFADASGVKLADIPNISAVNTSLTINQAAYVGDIMIEEAYQGLLTLNVSTYSLDMANETYSITFSNIWDEQQSNNWSGACYLYAALNNDTYIDCSKTIVFGSNFTTTGTLPFNIGYNDIVYFKLIVQ